MTLENQLKREILSRYKSIREFSSMTEIPYSTVDSVLKRGIKNSGVGTVIKIFSFLDIDVESIICGELRPSVSNVTSLHSGTRDGQTVSETEYRIVAAYRVASEADRGIIDNIVDRYVPAQSGETAV